MVLYTAAKGLAYCNSIPIWVRGTALLCIYGFLKEFRPVEPFLTPYLMSGSRNITLDLVNREVYPIWTYSYLVALVPVFLVTDLLRYKPVVIVEGASYAVTWSLLAWGPGLVSLQWMDGVYGIATATEVALYGYLYALAPLQHYQQSTSLLRASLQGGKALAYGIGQAIVSGHLGSYTTLNYISLASMFLTLAIALLLPSIPIERKHTFLESDAISIVSKISVRRYGSYVQQHVKSLWSNFCNIYRMGFVLKWSFWWAFATCGFFQIGNFIQNLWSLVEPDETKLYNGLCEFINTLLGSLTVLCMQRVEVDWEAYGEMTIGLISCLDAILLIIASQTKHILVAYITYALFRILYQVLITIASFNIAAKLKSQNYGLVFGWNTFIALVLQTILTLIVADQRGLALPIRTQFAVYAMYHAIIAAIFLIIGGITLGNTDVVKRIRNSRASLSETTVVRC